MSNSIACINRLTGEIAAVLEKNHQIKDAFRIRRCYGYRQCHSLHCIKCASRAAYHQRTHLLASLRAVLREDKNHQVWLLTGAAEDSPDVRTSAQSAVIAMKKLLKHKRLRARVVAHFSTLEVANKPWRKHPCCHVHTVLVTKRMDKGKYRISKADWLSMWEEACPLHRPRASAQCGQEIPVDEQPSFDVRRVKRTRLDLLRVTRYCTKRANPRRVAHDYRKLLSPDAQVFLQRVEDLKGVTKYFGPLHKSKKKRRPIPAGSSTRKTAVHP